MDVIFGPEARVVLDALPDREYHAIWDALDRILLDPEAAKAAPWASYVGSKRVWGEHVRGTDWSLYWDVENDQLQIHWLLRES